MDTLRIAQWGQLTTLYLPIYIAEKKGFFLEHDLQLELTLAGNDDETFAAVSSGAADFGVGDPTFCAMKDLQSVETKVVATVVCKAGTFGLTRNPVLPLIQNVSDLVNLRIGTLPSPSTTYCLISNLKQQNKRLLKSTEIIESSIGGQYSLLAKNKADIVLDIEPFVSIAEEQGCRVIYSFAKVHGPFSYTGLYTRKNFIESNPGIVEKVVTAINRALCLLRDKPEVALEVCAQVFPELDERINKKAVQRLRREKVWGANALTEQAAWQNAIRSREQLGEKFIDAPFSCVDNSFIP